MLPSYTQQQQQSHRQQQQQQQQQQFLFASTGKVPELTFSSDEHSPRLDGGHSPAAAVPRTPSPGPSLGVPPMMATVSTEATALPQPPFVQDSELNDLNTFIDEFGLPSDFAASADPLFMLEMDRSSASEDDVHMKVDHLPPGTGSYYNDPFGGVAAASTAPAVIFPNHPVVAGDPFSLSSGQSFGSSASLPPPGAEPAAGVLTIAEEPAQFGRFRYKSEKREKSLEGEKSFPEVMVNPTVLKTMTSGSITVSLVTRLGQPHWHELGGTTKAVVTPRQCRYKFNNLTVLMDRAMSGDSRRNKDDQRAVRLRFDLTFVANGKTYISTVMSRPIFNAKLQINKLSTTQGPVTGMTEVVILCSKVRKATTCVKIRDMTVPLAGSPPPSVAEDSRFALTPIGVWERIPEQPSGKFTMIPSNELGFHHQYAIIFNMPAYYNLDITEPAHVEILLIDLEDQTESQPCEFTYFPQESVVRRERAESKRRRLQHDADAFGGGGSGSGSSDLGGARNGGHAGGQSSFGGSGGSDGSGSGHSGAGTGMFPGMYMASAGAPLAPAVLSAFCMTGDVKHILRAQARTLAAEDEDGETALHIAIAGGQYGIATAMVDLVADALNDYTAAGETALHMATWSKHAPLIQKLIRYGARPDLPDARGRTPFHVAAEMGDLKTLTALTDFDAAIFSPPLHAQLALLDTRGMAPLHVAVLKNDLTVATKLLQLGADPLQRERGTGRTAIHMAVLKSNLSLTKTLLESAIARDPDAVNVRDNFGNTPLHLAAGSNDRLDLVTMLKAYGADTHALNEEGASPFVVAATTLARPVPMLQTLRARRPERSGTSASGSKTAEQPQRASSGAALSRKTSDDEWVKDDFDYVPPQSSLEQRDSPLERSIHALAAGLQSALTVKDSKSKSNEHLDAGNGGKKGQHRKRPSLIGDATKLLSKLDSAASKLDPAMSKLDPAMSKLDRAEAKLADTTPPKSPIAQPPPTLHALD